MKYLLILYGNKEKWDAIPADAWPDEIAKYEAFIERYRATGELVGGYGLADAAEARLVRRVDGAPVVTDGPYLEAKEHLASFYLIDCASGDRAREIAADLPHAHVSPVELWPVVNEAGTGL